MLFEYRIAEPFVYQTAGQFDYWTNGCHFVLKCTGAAFKMVGLVLKTKHIDWPFEIWTSKSLVFTCFQCSNGQYLDPHCTYFPLIRKVKTSFSLALVR